VKREDVPEPVSGIEPLTCRLQVCGESHVGKFARCWRRQWEYFGVRCRPAARLHSRLRGIRAALAARGWAVSSGSSWTNFLGRSRAPDRPRGKAPQGFVPHPGAASVVWVLVRRCIQITPISGPNSLPIMGAKLFDDTQPGLNIRAARALAHSAACGLRQSWQG